MDLAEWGGVFIKQRDLVKREIDSVEKTNEGFLIMKKGGAKDRVIVSEDLQPEKLRSNVGIMICINNKINVDAVHKNWKLFSKHEKLLVVFANPKTNEKWILKPHLHNRIAEKESLKEGLMSMSFSINS